MFLYGTADQSAVRSVYHTIEKSNTIPTFKVGSITCALKSSIRAKFWSQEKRAFANGAQEDLVRLHILLTSILNLVAANDNGSAASDPIRPLLAEAADTIQRVIPIEAR
jgi:translation initiation factor 6 (eIF-6)